MCFSCYFLQFPIYFLSIFRLRQKKMNKLVLMQKQMISIPNRLLSNYLLVEIHSTRTIWTEKVLVKPLPAQQSHFLLPKSVTVWMKNGRLLYNLTSIWVMCTPNPGRNLLLSSFLTFSQVFYAKMTKKRRFLAYSQMLLYKKCWSCTLQNW